MAGFGTQNWLITPAASAVGHAPTRIQDQKWLLVLSGVILLDLKGTLANDWRRTTINLQPGIDEPLQDAISRNAIPTPPGLAGHQWFKTLQVERAASFAAPDAIFNGGQSLHAGYAVDAWRLRPLASATDAFSSAPLANLYAGIHLDLAVRDKDAIIHRVGYHITLLGKIVFGKLGAGATAAAAASAAAVGDGRVEIEAHQA